MRCPGQDTRFWKPGDIFETGCPKCERKIEFFKDEVRRRCRCGHEVVNPKLDLGCAEWCPYAEQCIGAVPEELKARRSSEEKDLLREKMCLEMKKHFGTDYKHVKHTLKVARYAEKILKIEGGNPLVVLGAAYLHGIGPREEAPGIGPSEGEDPQAGGAMVREVLKKLDVQEGMASEIDDLIRGLRHDRLRADLESQILREAHCLAILEDGDRLLGGGEIEKVIDGTFRTRTGRHLAEEVVGISSNQ
jgi:hypothetical protein